MTADIERICAQRAIEALRNGVPSGDAVKALGCKQRAAIAEFTRQLDELERSSAEAPPLVAGTLLAGGFGTGKSHTLAWMEQEALARNFIVSRVVLSKETPLHAPAKVFVAAVREARLPDGRGSLLHELAARVDYRRPQAHSFLDWAANGQPYGLVGASVLIHERLNDPEMDAKVEDFWSGGSLRIPEVKAALRELGSAGAYDVKAVRIADLAPIRFEFAVRYARACGFVGWVLLLDEAELIARYSLLQRAKAYAELARWLAPGEDHGVRGLAAVAAITDDFAFEMIQERNDRATIIDRLTDKGDAESILSAKRAELALDIIEQESVPLRAPTAAGLNSAHQSIRGLYSSAYGWEPSTEKPTDLQSGSPMRAHVRRWISDWDLARLYPDKETGMETADLPGGSYDEDEALSAETDTDTDTDT
jgi:hypothetical protein